MLCVFVVNVLVVFKHAIPIDASV